MIKNKYLYVLEKLVIVKVLRFNYKKALYKSLSDKQRKLIDDYDARKDFETNYDKKLKFK